MSFAWLFLLMAFLTAMSYVLIEGWTRKFFKYDTLKNYQDRVNTLELELVKCRDNREDRDVVYALGQALREHLPVDNIPASCLEIKSPHAGQLTIEWDETYTRDEEGHFVLNSDRDDIVRGPGGYRTFEIQPVSKLVEHAGWGMYGEIGGL